MMAQCMLRWKACNGRASARVTGTARRMAMDFGINSPITTCRKVKEMMASVKEISLTHHTDMPVMSSKGATNASTKGSPRKPRASEAMVMPS